MDKETEKQAALDAYCKEYSVDNLTLEEAELTYIHTERWRDWLRAWEARGRASGQQWDIDRKWFISDVIRDVAELPDRNSPEGSPPEEMIVTSEDLRIILEARLDEYAASPQITTPAARPSNDWCDDRIKKLMADCGLPNSRSLYVAFKQFQNEYEQFANTPAAQPIHDDVWKWIDEATEHLNESIETEHPLEAEWSKALRKFIATAPKRAAQPSDSVQRNPRAWLCQKTVKAWDKEGLHRTDEDIVREHIAITKDQSEHYAEMGYTVTPLVPEPPGGT